MITDDRYLAIRAACLYVAVVVTLAVWAWRRPSPRAAAGAVLGFAWNLPVIVGLHLLARRFGWWEFDARGGLFLGMPAEWYFAWAWLWGAVPALALPHTPLALIVAAALGFDLLTMPAALPVLRLGESWLVGEALGLGLGVLPAYLLARWTRDDTRLAGRATLQMMAFGGLVLLVIPAAAIEGSAAGWSNPFERPVVELSLAAQLLALTAVPGISAVQEFVTRGLGTPVPFDPPRRLVTSGLYAYVRNPMQLSGVLTLLVLGLWLQNLWICGAALMSHIFSAGIASWDEDEDLRSRFEADWDAYRSAVRSWIPRWRPWHQADRPARLYVMRSCAMCRETGSWFATRAASGLSTVAAETHPSRALTRITYESSDGSLRVHGVAAVARALDHVHLAWALVGALLRLPGVGQLAQLAVDASGGAPRTAAPTASQDVRSTG